MSTHRGVLLTALLALFSLPVSAAVDVHASLSRDAIALGETTELTIAVSGGVGRVSEPQLPPMDAIDVVSTSSQQSIEFVNGRMSSTTTYVYTLRPTREGQFTIPGIDVHVAGEVYTTRLMTLTVSGHASSAPAPRSTPSGRFGRGPAPGEEAETPAAEQGAMRDVDIRLEVDNPTPYVGQQVIMTMSFYQAHTVSLLGSAEYSPPTTEGLVAEALPEEPPHTEDINGVPYRVVVRRTALFAPAPGEYTIGPATVEFRRSYMGGQETVSTDPIILKVRPLPSAGRPEGFSGLVGRVQARLQVPTDNLRVGEATTVRLTVEGTGDLRQLPVPELTVSDGARVYPTGEQRDVGPRKRGQFDVIGGTVNFDYLVMPEQVGALTINPIVISFFDPGTGRYDSARTKAVTLEVLPGEGGETSLHPEGDGVRPIKLDGLALHARPPVTSFPAFWGLQLIPLAGVAWALRKYAELRHREADARYRRFVEAAAEARARLRTVGTSLSGREACAALDDILTDYVAAKIGTAAASLSIAAARAELMDVGCSREAAEGAAELLSSLRRAVYGPAGAPGHDVDELRARVTELIARIEGELR